MEVHQINTLIFFGDAAPNVPSFIIMIKGNFFRRRFVCALQATFFSDLF